MKNKLTPSDDIFRRLLKEGYTRDHEIDYPKSKPEKTVNGIQHDAIERIEGLLDIGDRDRVINSLQTIDQAMRDDGFEYDDFKKYIEYLIDIM